VKAVVQRVSRASVEVNGASVASIGRGLVVLLGVEKGDSEPQAAYLAEKIPRMRLFDGAGGRMDRSLEEIGGEVLLVSQFTLAGRLEKGRRPSFSDAAPPEEARRLYERVAELLRASGARVQTGRFQQEMQVELVNDGPVTFLVERRP
jgi:D-tyrosyl-tRNA(Tyr) deacylase